MTTLPNGRIVLKFTLGTNKKTGEPQWQSRTDGALYIPHRDSMLPENDQTMYECERDFQIPGHNVIVVKLKGRHVSQTQKRKEGRVAHRQMVMA